MSHTGQLSFPGIASILKHPGRWATTGTAFHKPQENAADLGTPCLPTHPPIKRRRPGLAGSMPRSGSQVHLGLLLAAWLDPVEIKYTVLGQVDSSRPEFQSCSTTLLLRDRSQKQDAAKASVNPSFSLVISEKERSWGREPDGDTSQNTWLWGF